MVTYRQPFKKEWPITQGYGEAITSSFHTGIDYGCPMNTSILASADGQVMFAAWDNTGYGNFVIIEHKDGNATCYAHLSDISVKRWQNVRQGELLGHSGTSGNSTGPHLHFEARRVWNDYKSHFDPMTLPLTTVDDSISEAPKPIYVDLKPGPVQVIAPNGVYAHNMEFTGKSVLPYLTKVNFSGETCEHKGLVFAKCHFEDFWVAEHDGEIQLLDNM